MFTIFLRLQNIKLLKQSISSLILLLIFLTSPVLALETSHLVCEDIEPIFLQFKKTHYKFSKIEKIKIQEKAEKHIKDNAFLKELSDQQSREAAADFLSELTRILSKNILDEGTVSGNISNVCRQFHHHIEKIQASNHPLADVSESQILQQYLSYFFLSIDPFSNFVGVDKTLENLRPYISGYSKGIGITVDLLEKETDYPLIVTYIVKDSPADIASIERGDILLKINDIDLRDCAWECYTNLLNQPENADTFSITLLKRNNLKHVSHVVRRKMSPREYNLLSEAPSDVKTYDNNTKVGYLSLDSFYQGSGKDVQKLLKKLEKETDALVLNLQRNAGGNIKDMLEVISLFTNKGGVVGRSIQSDGSFNTFIAPPEIANTYTKPLIILVSNQTKSAAEFTAGVLQSLNRAIVVGLNGDQKTYGKGSSFTWFLVDKSDNGKVQYTTVDRYNENNLLGALYITSSLSYLTTGKSTHYVGVTPDIVLPKIQNDPVYLEMLSWLHHTESDNKNSLGPQVDSEAFISPGNNYNPSIKNKIGYLASLDEKETSAIGDLETQIDFSKILAARLANDALLRVSSLSLDKP